MSQLTEWTARRPREIPLLGKYAWLAMHTPEWAEAHDAVENVVTLPQRGGCRAAATVNCHRENAPAAYVSSCGRVDSHPNYWAD
jgi:hypothetical protein